jgi:hypothetical protein
LPITRLGLTRVRGEFRYKVIFCGKVGLRKGPRIEIRTLYLGTVCFRTTVPDLISQMGWSGTIARLRRTLPGYGTSLDHQRPQFPETGAVFWTRVPTGHGGGRTNKVWGRALMLILAAHPLRQIELRAEVSFQRHIAIAADVADGSGQVASAET